MGFRRSLLTLVCSLGALAACKVSTTAQTPTSVASLTMTPTSTQVKEGAMIGVKLTAVLSTDGTKTPLAGTVTLAQSGSATSPVGTLSATTVTLDATGTGSFSFTGSAATTGSTTISASFTDPAGDTATATVTLSVTSTSSTGTCVNTVANFCTVNAATCGGAKCSVANAAAATCGNDPINNTAECVATPIAGATVSLTLTVLDPNKVAPPSLSIPRGSLPYHFIASLTNVGTNTVPTTQHSVRFTVTPSGDAESPGSFQEEGADGGGFGSESTSVTMTVDANGRAEALFYPALSTTSGTITAEVTDDTLADGGPGASDTRIVDIVVPGLITFTPAVTDDFTQIMGVSGSSFNERDILRFTVYDATGAVATGVSVSFSVPQVGQVSVSPISAVTDNNGQVTTTLFSGTQAATIAVEATATIDGSTVTTESSSIAVVGAKASGSNFSVSCDKMSVNALVGNDCTSMHSNEQVNCTAQLGDRFNNALGRSVVVSWLTEAGLFGPPTQTPAALATPGLQTGLGTTSNVLSTLGGPMPVDVQPLAGEPFATSTELEADGGTLPCDNPTNPRTDADCVDGGVCNTYNPRDGLNTFIVMTQGEEGYTDLNDNGQWDEGEPFIDLGEPFIDENDNNIHDDFEPFVDLNNNGVYDYGNKKWDANTTIWTSGHVAFSDAPRPTQLANAARNQTFEQPATPSFTKPPQLQFLDSDTASITWLDENQNVPAPTETSYSASVLSGLGSFSLTTPASYPDSFASMAVSETTSCTGDVCSRYTNITYLPPAPQEATFIAPSESAVTSGTGATDAGTVATPDGGNGVIAFTSEVTFTATLSDVGVTVSTNPPQITGVEPQCPSAPNNADCTNSACLGLTCTSMGVMGTCGASGCNTGTGTNSSYQMAVAVTGGVTSTNGLRVPAGGANLSIAVSVLNRSTQTPAANQQVAFQTNNGIGVLSGNSMPFLNGQSTDGGVISCPAGALCSTTDSTGTATVQLTPGAAAALGLLTVTLISTNPEISITETINVATAGSIAFTPAAMDPYFPVMGVRTSGFNEQSLLRFTVLDSTGLPYLGQVVVDFAILASGQVSAGHAPLGGVTLVPTQLQTDENGQVVTSVYSGTQAGTFAVTASAVVNGASLSVQSPTIAVIGAQPSGRNFSVSCSTEAIPALVTNDCSYMHQNYSLLCSASLGDRFNNAVGREMNVYWLPEAGLFGPPSKTAAYDPTQPPTAQPTLGQTTNTLRTLNARMPEDVAPDDSILPGESQEVSVLCSHDCADYVSPLTACTSAANCGTNVCQNGFCSQAGCGKVSSTATPECYPVATAVCNPVCTATQFCAVTNSATGATGCVETGTAPNALTVSACPRTSNPRDGLATFIVATQGEEGFIDNNSNGQWDTGEPFYDVGEPYVDSNDNGQYDTNEPYIDVNGNGVWDGPNGVWDANTTIWTTGFVMFTEAGDLGVITPSPFPFVDYGATQSYQFYFRDINNNEPAPSASTYATSNLSYGTTKLFSLGTFTDLYGSLSISQPTNFVQPTTTTMSTVLNCPANASGAMICKQVTTMEYVNRAESALYSSPLDTGTPPPPLGDTIIGQVTVSTPGGSVVSQVNQVVPAAAVPFISSMSPLGGPPGTTVTLAGFGLAGSSTAVLFGTVPASIVLEQANEILFLVPTNAAPGNVTVDVQNTAGKSSSMTFLVGNTPNITSFSPTQGVVGTSVTILGSGLNVGGNPAVTIGGFPIPNTSLTLVSATQVRLTIPNGVTSGQLVLTTVSGVANPAVVFSIFAPTITSFSPASSVIGGTIVVDGQYFDGGGLTVDVNGTIVANPAVDCSAGPTNCTLTFTVPAAATTGPIDIVTNGGTVSSATNLTIP